MKKIKKFTLLLASFMLAIGCSCSKVNEETYTNAVNTFKSTDALSFSRIEMITNINEDNYTRKRVDAIYTFNSNKEVVNMEYSLVYSEGSNGGASNTSQTKKYYYNNERRTLYTYSKIGESQLDTYKETNVTYNAKFNINACENADCLKMITGNFAPMFNLNEVSEFSIEDKDGTGVVRFKAVCPSYESCASSSQVLDYNLTINKDGNIETLAYDINHGNTTYSIRYTFHGYGSNNVSVEFPADLESYIEK